MDFVAAIEDEFDIIISMNQQAEIETYGQLVDAVCELTSCRMSEGVSQADRPQVLEGDAHATCSASSTTLIAHARDAAGERASRIRSAW